VISFDAFSIEGSSPIYLQLILFVKRGLVAGNIRDGEELPSRRVLSARLGVNPNTIQKAYRLLEEEGLVRSQMGAASVITVNERKLSQIHRELLERYAKALGRAMKEMGLSRKEALGLLDQLWDDM
jgi:GntR family transcriptional regulator